MLIALIFAVLFMHALSELRTASGVLIVQQEFVCFSILPTYYLVSVC